MKKFFILAIMGIFLTGCAGVQINQPEQIKISESIGYTASYYILKNNPKYISIVESSIQGALKTLEEENVDIATMISDIIEFAEYIIKDVNEDYVNLVKEALKSFEGMVTIDLDIPENYDKAILLTKAFLTGALRGLEDAK